MRLFWTGAATAKGILMASVLAVLNVPFVQAIIIATISALITGIFAVLSAAVASHVVREEMVSQRKLLHEVNENVKQGSEINGA